MIPYSVDNSVHPLTEDTIEESVAFWNNKIAAPKFEYDPFNTNCLKFFTGDFNGYNGFGFKPDEKNWIQLKLDENDVGPSMIEVLKLMGNKAGLSV